MGPDSLTEVNFDGLPGPAHNYAGLSPGNFASMRHAGRISNPRQAALDSLDKMRFVMGLGVPQGVLPPHERPLLTALRALGCTGGPADVLAEAKRGDAQLLRLCSSASAMWTANAATVVPSTDTLDRRAHFVVANLNAMFHRSLEAKVTERVLRAIFHDEQRFAVHGPLPPGPAFADEGAANHTRLSVGGRSVHLFAWGRRQWGSAASPRKHPARQTLEASQAVARLASLPDGSALTWQQHPNGIDAGAFHTDVLAVGNRDFLLFHELAFVDSDALLARLAESLGPGLLHRRVASHELGVDDAVAAYPFNSQLIGLPDGKMALVAPEESRANPAVADFLRRLEAENNPISRVCFARVAGSMKNGGGPACLRLRVPLLPAERQAIAPRVLVDADLLTDLRSWTERHYRDRLALEDLSDPLFLREMHEALDALTQLLAIGSVYDFQR